MIVDDLDTLSDEYTVYLNSRTNETVGLTYDDLRAAEQDADLGDYLEWQQEVILEAKEVLTSDYYIALPSRYQIHDYDIMQQFCRSVENDDDSEVFLDAIIGAGAFRRFRTLIRLLDLEGEWYRFLEQALTEIAIEWLEDKDIPYRDDISTVGCRA